MVLFIQIDDQDAVADFVGDIAAVAFQVLPREIRNGLEETDQAITDHIGEQFRGRTWDRLQPMTTYMRSLRKNPLPKGVSSKAARKLWYRRQAPKGGSPYSSSGYGWTQVAKGAALAPGKITGSGQALTLNRQFRSKGKKARQRLEWWHFGTKTRVTPKMRNFLHRVGVHLKKTTVELKREPRPIYLPGVPEKLANERIRKRMDAVARALDGAGLSGVRIVRR